MHYNQEAKTYRDNKVEGQEFSDALKVLKSGEENVVAVANKLDELPEMDDYGLLQVLQEAIFRQFGGLAGFLKSMDEKGVQNIPGVLVGLNATARIKGEMRHKEKIMMLEDAVLIDELLHDGVSVEEITDFSQLFSPPSIMGIKHCKRWIDNIIHAKAVCDYIKEGSVLLDLGEGNQHELSFQKNSYHFLKGITQQLVSGIAHTPEQAIVQYQESMNLFLEKYSESFDHVYTVLDRDRVVFPHRKERLRLHQGYAQEHTDIEESGYGDPTGFLKEILTNAQKSENKEKNYAIVLSGHGSKYGMVIDGKRIDQQILEELEGQENITLILDACNGGGMVAEESERTVMANSIDGTAAMSSYSDRQRTALSRQRDPQTMGDKHLTKLFDKFGYVDGLPGNIWPIFDQNGKKIEMKLSTYNDIQNMIERALNNMSTQFLIKGEIYAKNEVGEEVIEGREDQITGAEIVEVLSSLYTHQRADMNQDGTVSFAEERIFLMQNYFDSDLPTRFESNGEQIMLASNKYDLSSEVLEVRDV